MTSRPARSETRPGARGTEHRAWVEVDLGAIRHNFRQLERLVSPARLAPVVKSEAYGHGLLPVARTVLEEGAWGLCVVHPEEGRRLRADGLDCPIIVVGPVLEWEMEQAIIDDLAVAVFSEEQARALSDTALRLGRKARAHVKVDTGLARMSHYAEEAVPFIQAVRALPGLNLEGIYSHFADAEGLDQSYTLLQFKRFQKCLSELSELGIEFELRHISGSAAGMLLSQARLDLVRLGIALYGLWPAEETRLLLLSRGQDLLQIVNEQFQNGCAHNLSELLLPALSYKTVVLQVKQVPAGCKVGYGCTYETQRATRIAVLPVGYAEGYDRHLSNSGEVLVRGRRARVLGRICMNLTVVDVTDIPEVEAHDEVVLIGRQGDAVVSADEVAAKIGTINYEVVTRIPANIPRVYRDSR